MADSEDRSVESDANSDETNTEAGTSQTSEQSQAGEDTDSVERFDKESIELFMSSCHVNITPPEETHLRCVLFYNDDPEVLRSEVFKYKKDERCAAVFGEDYLGKLSREELETVETVVFFQNYAPSDAFAQDYITFKDENENIEIDVVYVKGNWQILHQLMEKEIKTYKITSWKWIAFLLWNQGYLPDLHWWKLEDLAECEDKLADGLEKAGIEYTHTRTYLERLLQKTVYHMCDNVKENGTGKPLSHKEFAAMAFGDDHLRDEEAVTGTEHGESFTKEDIEIFMSTCDCSLNLLWPKKTKAQCLIIKQNGQTVRSEVFQNEENQAIQREDRKHAEWFAMNYLQNMGNLESAKKVIFFQNYAPCAKCVTLFKIFKDMFNKIEIDVVFVKDYDNRKIVDTLSEQKVNAYKITSWKWMAFLLWNQGRLPSELEWWRLDDYAKCEEELANGFSQAGIEYIPVKVYLLRLLQKSVYHMCADVRNLAKREIIPHKEWVSRVY